METKSINMSIKNATKWSSITEIVAKMISPITNIILARLLTPETFGIVATVTMVFSFADMFTDAGFQKYIIQHEFGDKEELYRHADVAFWSNFSISIVFWILISFFSEDIATIVGCSGLGEIFVVSGVSLPLTSLLSIQTALYRRNFDFKTLFQVRIVGVLLPLFITVPIAFFTHSYWALIVGSICGNLSNAIILTVKSQWKPKFFYGFSVLKEMLTFSTWSLIEAISIWLTNYIGIFIVGTILSTHYLGLYKTAMTTVNQFTSIITAAFTPVLFSALSRLQENREQFRNTFLRFQRITSYLVVSMGIGIFLYRDLITNVLLGSQWTEASGFVGLWGVVSTIKIIYSNYCYEVYRAYGRPKLAVLAQICQLVVLIPAIYFSAKSGFAHLYIARSLVVVELLIVNQLIMRLVFKFSCIEMIKNTYSSFIASFIMALAALLFQKISTGTIWSFISIGLCAGIYFISMYTLFPKQRTDIKYFLHYVLEQFKRKDKAV